jgi:periplasmic protein TonB
VRLRFSAVVIVALLLVAGAWWWLLRQDELPPPRRVQEITVVRIIPPPPPPPVVQPPPKMIEQPKMAEPELKADKPIEKPKEIPKEAKDEPPPGPLSLAEKPVGPGDLFNLGGNPGGRGLFGGPGGGSRWGWYASIVQQQIEAALRANEHTKNAVYQMQMNLWADSTGRITRVQLTSSSGNAELDNIIRDTVVGTIQLREPPPKDMPMPIVTRVTERQPN